MQDASPFWVILVAVKIVCEKWGLEMPGVVLIVAMIANKLTLRSLS